ncbi:hypothetical protein OH799_20805 [Nocardia sp. NBC_00881]|uniref:hypothetical protein n=1 Tax=Nocardia sp. NBC_00881 TaxID=2975995 RepID=UPI00386D1AA9|nr:hypothetical protein OH799_20805 [Nocardia sp. NBC_00881]
MTSRRPVNRVTSKRRPGAEHPSRAATTRTERPAPSGRTRPAGASRATIARGKSGAEQRPERGSAPSRFGKVVVPTAAPSPGSGAGSAHWTLVSGLLIAAVLLGAFAVVAAKRPGVDTSNQAFVNNEATQEVRAAADHALRTVYAYDVKNIDGYRGTAAQVLTGKMLADLDKYAGTTISAVKQAQTSADAKADPIAVSLLTEDRAELLVNLVVSATKDGLAQQSVAGPVVLHMQKVDGRWLASDIVDQ